MSIVTRAQVLGVSSALALGSSLLTQFSFAVQRADAGDVKSLNAAIALERAGVTAYTAAAATGFLSPPVLDVTKAFMADHVAHLAALTTALKAIGATATDETAKLDYPTLATEADILNFAYTIERLAANSYLGVIATFKNRDLAKISATILGVETTHVALLAEALAKGFAYPSGFAGP
jgi:rubrerythrin